MLLLTPKTKYMRQYKESPTRKWCAHRTLTMSDCIKKKKKNIIIKIGAYALPCGPSHN